MSRFENLNEIVKKQVQEIKYQKAMEIEPTIHTPPNPLGEQVGGQHYRAGTIQPVEYIESNQLPFLEGCVIKRVTRHHREGGKGAQDIDKAIHELQLLKYLRYGN